MPALTSLGGVKNKECHSTSTVTKELTCTVASLWPDPFSKGTKLPFLMYPPFFFLSRVNVSGRLGIEQHRDCPRPNKWRTYIVVMSKRSNSPDRHVLTTDEESRTYDENPVAWYVNDPAGPEGSDTHEWVTWISEQCILTNTGAGPIVCAYFSLSRWKVCK